jgi:peptidoglycan/LPS O-acetylase OafA/YrhL
MFLSHHLLPYLTLFANTSYATYLDSLSAIRPSAQMLSALWTISVEEQFYLVFPLVMVTAGPFLTLGRAVPYIVAATVFSIGARYYIISNAIPDPMATTATLAHFDPIVLGIGAAVLWHRHGDVVKRARLFGADLLLGLGALILVVIGRDIPGDRYDGVWRITAAGLSSTLLLLSVLRYGWLGAALGWRPVRWLGRISYGLYVYRMGAIQLYSLAIGPSIVWALPDPYVAVAVRFSASLLLTVLFATVSYYAFERPFLRLKDRWAVVPSRVA